MTEIYLCDDEPVWITQMEQAVSDFIISCDWKLSIVCRASSPQSLLEQLVRNETRGGIYFLDIGFKSDSNGIELGAQIRKLDPDATLVFVTVHEEMVMDTFRLKLQATDYILKDSGNIRSQIFDTLSAVESRHSASAKAFIPRIRINTGSSYHFLTGDDIYFIESQKNQHKLFIHMKSEIFTASVPLKEMERQLGGNFILCKRGCLVNPLHVIEADPSTRELIFDNKERCSCSFRTWHLVLERLT